MIVQVQDDHIAVSVPPNLKDLAKSVPNARWSSYERKWIYPRSPITAHIIKRAFSGVNGLLFDHSIFTELSRAPVVKQADLMINKVLWGHQLDGVGLTTIRDGCMLNFGMGCGKSLTAIASMNWHGVQNTIIACPKAVVGVWPKQFNLHSLREYRILRLDEGGTDKKIKLFNQFWPQRSDIPKVVVINYDSLWRGDLGKMLLKIKWDMFIMDESHRIKSHDSSAKASKFCSELALKATKRLALTGTPMPHSPMDLFAQFRAIDNSLFGVYKTPFKDRYTIKGGFQDKVIVGFKNTEEMKDRFNILSHTVTKEEALDLPEEIDVDIDLELCHKAKVVYKKLQDEFIAWLEDEMDAGVNHVVVAKNALGKLLRLQQITSGYVHTDDDKDIEIDVSKLEALKDILMDHGKENKVVVFCRFKHDLKAVAELCASMKLNFAELSGAKHELTKDATIPDEVEVMIVQVQSGSVGVDFSKACIAVDYSVGFSLGDWMQSRSRLHRPGQVNKVTYYHLKCRKTVDEKIYKAFKQKQDVINMILEEGYED